MDDEPDDECSACEGAVLNAHAALDGGDLDACARELDRATRLLGTPDEQARGEARARSVEGDVAWMRGWLARKRGDRAEEQASFEQAVAIRRGVVELDPVAPSAAINLIEAHIQCAVVLHRAGAPTAEVDARCMEAFEVARRCRAAGGRSPGVVGAARGAIEALRGFHLERGEEPADIAPLFEGPIAWLRECRRESPADAEIADSLGRLLLFHGEGLVWARRTDEGMACLDESIALARERLRMHARGDEISDPRYDVAFTLSARAEAAAYAGLRERALADVDEAEALFDALRREDPTHPWADLGSDLRADVLRLLAG